MVCIEVVSLVSQYIGFIDFQAQFPHNNRLIHSLHIEFLHDASRKLHLLTILRSLITISKFECWNLSTANLIRAIFHCVWCKSFYDAIKNKHEMQLLDNSILITQMQATMIKIQFYKIQIFFLVMIDWLIENSYPNLQQLRFDVGHAIHRRQPNHSAMIHSIRPLFTGKIDDGATLIVCFRQSRHTIHMDRHRTMATVAIARMTVDTIRIDWDQFAKSPRIAVSNSWVGHFWTILLNNSS